MNVSQLYQDYSIPTAPEGHRHHREGWINVACPFCTGHEGFHLGATLDGRIFKCFRCGIHWPNESISKILKISLFDADKLIQEYAGTSYTGRGEIVRRIRSKAHRLPSNVLPLTASHASYLFRRGFDPDKLEYEWDLKSTGPISILDSTDYGHRIIAPIYWEGLQVSFQARDVTNRHSLKYLSCPEDRELIHYKHLIYRHPKEKLDVGVAVEGITDVWRFGIHSFATFGIGYTRQQVRLISKVFQRVAVCFDGGEEQARKSADQLIADLRFRGVDSFRIDIQGDPGDLDQNEADYIIKQIIH